MTQKKLKPKDHSKPIFVARQPVFDRDESIWGYELLFRAGESFTEADVKDQKLATAKVIADGFSMAMDGLDHDKKILINFPADLLLSGANLVLPKDKCVIEILETVQPTEEIIAACKKIKAAGYLLALDDFIGQQGFEPFLEIADLVKVDVYEQSPAEIIKLSQYLGHYPCTLLAEKIEDIQTYQLTRTLGFKYYQGFLFSKPEMLKGRKVSTEKISKVQLLHKLADDNYNAVELSKIISTDISLSYRLLKYLNSAYFAFQKKIVSLEQAIAILGSNPLKQWLAVVILSDIDHTERAEELVFTSVRRARFLEQITKLQQKLPYRRETMFMLGLLSMLDALLGRSMAEIMPEMPLDDEIKAAFLGEKNQANELLNISVFLDFGDWSHLSALLAKHYLDPKQVAVTYHQATTWANNLLMYY